MKVFENKGWHDGTRWRTDLPRGDQGVRLTIENGALVRAGVTDQAVHDKKIADLNRQLTDLWSGRIAKGQLDANG